MGKVGGGVILLLMYSSKRLYSVSSPHILNNPSIHQPASTRGNNVTVKLVPKLSRQVSTHSLHLLILCLYLVWPRNYVEPLYLLPL